MLEENAAYAIASWKRFDDAVPDELLRAITGAFALVAAADGDLADAEVGRFLELIKNEAPLIAHLDFGDVERRFRDICAALMSNPEPGRQQTLEYIAQVKDNEPYADLVRSAAEIAMAADNRNLDDERAALDVVCNAVGLLPRF